jgi:hypothetical protein
MNKKLIILASGLFLAMTVQAQIKLNENKGAVEPKGLNQSQIDVLKSVAGLNGALVGYGNFCKFEVADTDLIYKSFLYQLSKGKLSEDESKILRTAYEKQMAEAMKTGPTMSSMTCATFKTQYDAIVKSIKSGKLTK